MVSPCSLRIVNCHSSLKAVSSAWRDGDCSARQVPNTPGSNPRESPMGSIILCKTNGVGTLKPSLEKNKAKLLLYVYSSLIQKFMLDMKSEVKTLQLI